MSAKAKTQPKLPEHDPEKVDQWFSGLIEYLKVDHMLIKEDVASKEKKDFYQKLIFGGAEDLFADMRKNSTRFFIGQVIVEYLRELEELKNKPGKLALGLSDSKIMVWAEIEDGDEAAEDALFMAEAKVNGKFHSKGFYINSTIVEKSDCLNVPPHYQPII
jgi:hypothetical protein